MIQKNWVLNFITSMSLIVHIPNCVLKYKGSFEKKIAHRDSDLISLK